MMSRVREARKALFDAVAADDVDAVTQCRAQHIYSSETLNLALAHARSVEMVNALAFGFLGMRVDLHAYNFVTHNRADLLEALLKIRILSPEDYELELKTAMEAENLPAVRLLLGKAPSASGVVIQKAITEGHPEMLRIALDAAAPQRRRRLNWKPAPEFLREAYDSDTIRAAINMLLDDPGAPTLLRARDLAMLAVAAGRQHLPAIDITHCDEAFVGVCDMMCMTGDPCPAMLRHVLLLQGGVGATTMDAVLVACAKRRSLKVFDEIIAIMGEGALATRGGTPPPTPDAVCEAIAALAAWRPQELEQQHGLLSRWAQQYLRMHTDVATRVFCDLARTGHVELCRVLLRALPDLEPPPAVWSVPGWRALLAERRIDFDVRHVPAIVQSALEMGVDRRGFMARDLLAGVPLRQIVRLNLAVPIGLCIRLHKPERLVLWVLDMLLDARVQPPQQQQQQPPPIELERECVLGVLLKSLDEEIACVAQHNCVLARVVAQRLCRVRRLLVQRIDAFVIT